MRKGIRVSSGVNEGEALPMPHPLRPYQWEGVSFLARGDAALLADEMGLGKTVQAVTAVRIVRRQQAVRRVLVVTPASLRLNWEREFGSWAPDLVVRRVGGSIEDRFAFYNLPIPVLIASYDQIRADALAFPRTLEFDLVILDEAQRIKNSASDTSLACRLLGRKKAWALTGTPLENRATDLTSIYRFLQPELLHHGMTLSQIHERIETTFLRRKKTDVLPELPPIITQDILLELRGQQHQAYLDAWRLRTDILEQETRRSVTASMLGLITRLKQLCNFHPGSGESVKLDALNLSLESLRQSWDKVIIFSQYVQTLNWLSQQLDLPHDIFHGGLSEPERDRIVRDFEARHGPRALLMSLRAGGLGLNLSTASTVILFDRWWNPALENQAIQRAHRFGRKQPLHVLRFLVVDSIEERIATVLQKKQMLFDEYVESAASATVDPLTRKELAWILQIPGDHLSMPGVV